MPPLPPLTLVEEPDARVQDVPESVLQDLWLHRRYAAAGLATTTGEAVDVVASGRLNRHAGPDFSGARIRLTPADGPPVLLAGDVEVHRSSGEWLLHRHDEDPRYDRVVLHVTMVEDRHTGRLRRSDGTVVPEVVLLSRLETPLRSLLYRFFARPTAAFPCEASWPGVPEGVKRPWVRRLGAARLRAHADRLAPPADTPEGALDDALDQALVGAVLRALGFAPNADAMAELARRLPFDLLAHLDHPDDVAAVLFSTAGLLPSPDTLRATDPAGAAYAADLTSRAERFARVLRPMPAVAWTFFRLRPPNFPTRRLAQAAALLAPGAPLHVQAVEPFGRALWAPKPVHALRHLLCSVEPAPFWEDHVRFGQPTKPSSARIGKDRADQILTDAVLPVLLLDARRRRDPALSARVLEVYGLLPAADDAVVRPYLTPDFEPRNAREAQGLHALARGYCADDRCLRCAVGRHLLQGGG